MSQFVHKTNIYMDLLHILYNNDKANINYFGAGYNSTTNLTYNSSGNHSTIVFASRHYCYFLAMVPGSLNEAPFIVSNSGILKEIKRINDNTISITLTDGGMGSVLPVSIIQ